MGRLFCIIGKSGSGKDTVLKQLLSDSELKLAPVVTYTTRPIRKNETDGVEYHFISEEELERFKKAGRIIEMRKYDTVKGVWYYCTIDDNTIDLFSGDYLVIATLEGLEGIKRRFGEKVVPIYIEVDDGDRLSRAFLREKSLSSPDYYELCRRFLSDGDDFSKEKLKKAGVFVSFSNENLDRCVELIKNYILDFDSKKSI